VPKTVELVPGQLAGEILGQVEVDLRARQSDVPEVGRKQRELGSKVRATFVPAEQTKCGEGMAQVMETRVFRDNYFCRVATTKERCINNATIKTNGRASRSG
jgi:hypothetical protein